MSAVVLLGRQVNFTYELSVEPIQALPGRHSLVVVSIHYAARRPGPQRKLQVSATRNELVELHRELGQYLNAHQEA